MQFIPMKIVIFASGSGSNAENIVNHFIGTSIQISAIFCNVEGAGVIQRAERLGIPLELFNKEEWTTGDRIDLILSSYQPDLIVLAGFLWKFPLRLLSKFPHVLNVHPALLPKFGGKGMYGMNVHQAVVDAKEIETGITIHWVNEHYDEGAIIFQATCKIDPNDTPMDVAQKIHQLEGEHFPRIVEEVLKDIEPKS
jgi:phosphoribosylglycinamide formyltransferase 1